MKTVSTFNLQLSLNQMKPFSELFHSGVSITAKLLFLNLMIFIVFGIISIAMFLAFHNIESLTTDIIDKNVSFVIHNARSERELSEVFAKTNLLVSTFYKDDARWKTDGERMMTKTEQLLRESSDKEMKDALQAFQTKLALLFQQCLVINNLSERTRSIASKTEIYFRELEEVIAENMILSTINGKDISLLEQIKSLIPSYKENLMNAALYFANLDPLRSDTRDAEPIIPLLKGLSLSARPLLESESEISDYGHKIIGSTSEYQEAIIAFNNARIIFHGRLSELNTAKENVIRLMKKADKEMLNTYEMMREKTADIMKSYIRFVFILSGIVIILFGIFTYIFFLLNIRKPMDTIREGLEAISDGDIETRLCLNRKDEWSIIENSINRMVSEVWHTYSELYRKNEELFRKNVELQDIHKKLEASMKELEVEVSERRQAQEELQRTQRYIKNIIDSMPSVMIGVDHKGRVTHWNMAAERVVGIKAEDTRGRLITEVYPDIASQMDQIRRSLRHREPVKAEKRVIHQENEIRYHDIMIYPLVANGVEGAVIRIDDVTSRVRIEEMMIQTEKMMSVGGLAAGMAHEINNPLGVILQSVQNAFRRLSPDLEVNIRTAKECGTDLEDIRTYLEQRGIFRYLNGVRDAGARAARIVTNMLNFSRSGGANMMLTDINKLLDDTVDLAANDYDLKKKYDFRHIRIIREYDYQLPQVRCTPTEIEQVILNLLKNSAQAMSEISKNPNTGEERDTRIMLRTRKDGEYAVIEVEDNGPGMGTKQCKRIFEPFYTTKGVGVGTGLGLSVSYFIITNNHKGAMEIESEPGRGAKFIIHLPFGQTGT